MSETITSRAIVDILADLSRRGISFWLDGEALRYRAPVGSPPDRLDEVRARKAEVVEFLRQARNTGVIPPLQPRKAWGPAPLTSSQEVWWRLAQIPGEHDWFPTMAIRLTGPVDPMVVERALQRIIERHEVLRTTFPLVDGAPAQTPGPADAFRMTYLDYSEYDRTEAEARAVATYDQEHVIAFDIINELPIRAKLVRTAEDQFIFWIVVHHIAVDLFSFRIFSQEFRAFYIIESEGLTETIPPLPVQMSDVGQWEKAWLGDDLEVHRRFWQQQLGAVPPLEPPLVAPRHPHDLCREAALEVALPGALHAEMRGLARQEGVTVSILLLAAFQAALHRWTGQDDVLIGIWHRGRFPGVEKLIGLFSRLRPAYACFADDPSFTELIGQVRVRYADTHNLRHTVSHEFVRSTRIHRVMANFDRSPFVERPKSSQLTSAVKSEIYAPTTAEPRLVSYELMLALAETPMGVRGTLRYAIDQIGKDAARYLVELMGQFLQAAVASPETSVRRLLERSHDQVMQPAD